MFYRSIEVLSQYPNQVIVLKGTQAVCGLSGRASGLQRRLIDEKRTREFAKFCHSLSAAKHGDSFSQDQLLTRSQAAAAHMERMLRDATTLPNVFDQVAEMFTEPELKRIRNGSTYTAAMTDKIMRFVLEFAARLFIDHPNVAKLPSYKELPNTFIFRSALCGYLLCLHWISVGGAKNIRAERMRNDVVDISFAVYATYFDGLLTADKKLKKIYQDAKVLLCTTFGSAAPASVL